MNDASICEHGNHQGACDNESCIFRPTPPPQQKEQWMEELKGLSMVIPDGSLKDCLVYHEAVVDFISTQLEAAEKRGEEKGMSHILALLRYVTTTHDNLDDKIASVIRTYNARRHSPTKNFDSEETTFRQAVLELKTIIASLSTQLEAARTEERERIRKELQTWIVEVPSNPEYLKADEDINQLCLHIGRTNYNKALDDVLASLTNHNSPTR